MDREAWNARYRSAELVWGSEPNRFVAEALGSREPAGRALDLACGEGRNAIWLARRGWKVTGVDYSDVAIERARQLAASAGVLVEWIRGDATTRALEAGAFALVIVSYLQLPGPELRRVLERAAAALAPGGELFGIGHARRNLAEGIGGPQDASVLWDAQEIGAWLRALGLRVECCEEVLRPVEVQGQVRNAIDLRVEAWRTAEAA